MSPYPSCVLVVLGAGNAAFNTTLERFQKEFGRELVEGIPDRRDDVWNSLKVGAGQSSSAPLLITAQNPVHFAF